MKVNQAHHAFLDKLLHLLREAGVSPEQLVAELARRGIAASPNALTDISGADALVLLETAVELSGDPCLMVRLGKQLGIANFGSFGFALMSCANVRESVRLMLRYGQVLIQPGWIVHEYEGGLLVRARISLGTAVQQQLFAELAFSNLAAGGRSLYESTVERSEGVEIHFSYSRPAHSACYKRAFQAPITFDCEHNQLFLPAQVLDTPVRTANRPEYVVFQQQCEEMLRGLYSAEGTTAAVRQLLIQSAGDFLDIAQVAERLHVSERTLRRRLDAESTNFRSVFDEIRDLLAREYLAKTELTIADIAHLLDYAETVSFRRAFVRWNGVTPSRYRKQHVAENASPGFATQA
ncbi:AraC family transcriptional regulator [Halieaceae bacterium IMCC8485]|uniref:AraC family transcriptional regulator n=1 Tax=Candidatus Seongchinamella marina TaxID=2518990 RepID=A0ABT3SZE8_9GAMM|nr:AraC family transcriptional regulator [Candidatus Seongchinamella marina]MCX2975005.1 AraC family transcriptional regulator [Candidatus Seongchinamella marina]